MPSRTTAIALHLAVTGFCLLAIQALTPSVMHNHALAQSGLDPEQTCIEIDTAFVLRLSDMREAVAPAPEQMTAWRLFEQEIKTAHATMRGPCAAGHSGIALKMKIVTTAPRAMDMIARAAERLKPALTVAQQQRFAKVME